MPREIAVDPEPLAVKAGFPWPVTPVPLAEFASLGVLPMVGDEAGGAGARNDAPVTATVLAASRNSAWTSAICPSGSTASRAWP